MNTPAGKALVVALAAVGASLSTLVALSDPSDPWHIYEAALLAGITAASAALTHQITKKDDDQDDV